MADIALRIKVLVNIPLSVGKYQSIISNILFAISDQNISSSEVCDIKE